MTLTRVLSGKTVLCTEASCDSEEIKQRRQHKCRTLAAATSREFYLLTYWLVSLVTDVMGHCRHRSLVIGYWRHRSLMTSWVTDVMGHWRHWSLTSWVTADVIGHWWRHRSLMTSSVTDDVIGHWWRHGSLMTSWVTDDVIGHWWRHRSLPSSVTAVIGHWRHRSLMCWGLFVMLVCGKLHEKVDTWISEF